MKKILTILLSAMMVISLVGCAQSSSESSSKAEKIEAISASIGAPDGLPAIAMAKLAKEENQIVDGCEVSYTVEETSDALSTDVMKQTFDIAIVPSNMAAVAYKKTSNYQIAGTIGMGSFYLVSSDEKVTGLDASLEGKKVGNIGKGLTPDITVQALIKEQGVDLAKVEFDYSNSASDLVPLLIAGKLDTAIVPEPALTGLLAKNDKMKIVASVNDTWKEAYKSQNGYPQSTVIVKSDFAEANPEFVDKFLTALDESIAWANENPSDAGTYASEIGVSTKKEVIAKALERANLKFISANDAKADYDNYFKILNDFNAKTIGGEIPNEGIYYIK